MSAESAPAESATSRAESEAQRPDEDDDEHEGPRPARVGLVLTLGAVTLVSMLYAGAGMHGVEVVDFATLLQGWDFAIPLMAILLCHELGHYVAGRIRGVDISLPYFIPMPVALLGTMGAVISMRGRIKTRDALFDVGAAGPYAGLVIALPVLIYGIATSPVEPLSEDVSSYIFEGHSLLYAGLLYAIHGAFPAGHDISLSATAFAGWAGLLVTMMNLLPVGQLDGGHVGYALLGERHHRFARAVHYALPVVALITGLYYVGLARLAGYPWDVALEEIGAGVYWLVWFGVLHVIARFSGGPKHPPTDDATLSPGRRVAAWATLALFVLLFMPSWIRTPLPPLTSVTSAGAPPDATAEIADPSAPAATPATPPAEDASVAPATSMEANDLPVSPSPEVTTPPIGREVAATLIETWRAAPGGILRRTEMTTASGETGDGVQIFGIRTDDPMATLGFQNGDIVHSLNGMSTSDEEHLRGAFEQLRASPEYRVEVIRDGSPETLLVNVRE